MIQIGNNTWRTLQQPIYVNDKKVLEVWVNGDKLVYPENSADNTFIKIRGKVSLNEAYGEDEITASYPFDYYWHQPAYSGVFRGTAEFAACFKCHVGTDDRPFILTNNHSGELNAGPKSFLPLWILNNHNDATVVVPKSMNRKTIGFTQYRDTYHGDTPWYTGRIIYRQNIAACTMLPEVTKSTWSYGSPDTDYSYTARVVNPFLTEITAFNGVAYKEEFDFTAFSGGYIYIEREVDGVKLRVSFYYTGSTAPQLNVALLDFIRPNGLLYTDISYRGMPVADQTEDLHIHGNLFSVPVTDIMYLGREEDAPEEMRDVTVADLNF